MESMKDLDTIQLVRGFFLLGAGLGLALHAIPPVRRRYVDYGTRSAVSSNSSTSNKSNQLQLNFIDRIMAYPVPHTYFLHYYLLSLACSLFWGFQIVTRGLILRSIVPEPKNGINESQMDIDQVVVLWALMTAQAYRRLHETYIYMKPSVSTMPLSIYLIGIAYYLVVNVAFWIEGSDAILTRDNITDSFDLLRPRSLWTLAFLSLFCCVSGIQNDCHRYLASLKKYTLPVHPIFQRLVCPHYTMECLIYLCMAFIGAPSDRWINGTLLTVVVFVVTNLGLVADRSKKWSIEKFGAEKVEKRWRMIPWIW